MKIIKHLLTAILTVTTLFFVSCKKSSTNSVSGIKYNLQTTNRSAIITRITAGNLQWVSGYGSATEIKFEAENNNHEVKFESNTPQHLDLFSSIITLGTITLPPGTYTTAEFEIELTPTGTDAALQLNGQFTSGSVTTPVVFIVNSPLEIKNEQNNVVVTDNNSYNALTTINLSLLTTGVTEAMLNNAVLTNGSIIISSTSNTDIYNLILNNLGDSDNVKFDHD